MQEKKNITLISAKNPKSLLPNALTIIGVCSGLSSIKFALDSNFDLAIIALLFAAILDSLDGRIARLIRVTSKVGKELDSLTDVISFGVAPGFIMYFWSIKSLGKIGWMIVLIYAVCCALRLARFNLTSEEHAETWKVNFFQGVPSPAGAGLVLLPLILNYSNFYILKDASVVSAVVILITSFLMVSNIPTYSLKKIIIPRNYTIFLLLGIGTYFGLLVVFTFQTLFISGLVYCLFIPVSYFHFKILNKKFKFSDNNLKKEKEEVAEDIL